MTSNGGALLLREARRGLDQAKVWAGYIRDARDPAKVIHSYASMIDARIGVIACGHEDCDDLDVIRHAVRRIRSNWPRIAITVRGDAHYGTPEVMDVLEDMGCLYISGLSGNKRLADVSAQWRDSVATRCALGSA